jgi:gliding motility associated protien GldN
MNKIQFIVGTLCIISSSMFAQVQNSTDGKSGSTQKTESSAPSEDMFVDGLVKKTLIEDNRLMATQPIREADIVWEKRVQRVIDTREKLNLPLRSQESNLFNVLRDLVKDGQVTLFGNEQFTEPMTSDDLDKKLFKLDTITDFNYETYVEEIKVVKNDINPEDINSYRIKEVWYFDKQRSRMDVRIIGIAPIYASPKDIESGIPPSPLFWVYYPEARMPLSKIRTFNDDNDVAPMTYADIFDSRIFSSYIYKRSNVLDYRLKDYFDPTKYQEEDSAERMGVDMLLYSEKIKNELLNFEHDLWEY